MKLCLALCSMFIALCILLCHTAIASTSVVLSVQFPTKNNKNKRKKATNKKKILERKTTKLRNHRIQHTYINTYNTYKKWHNENSTECHNKHLGCTLSNEYYSIRDISIAKVSAFLHRKAINIR